jgi:two-component system, response regulator PdtaR
MDHQFKVLLVEDDPIVLDAAVETLAEGGCEVHSASSYSEAIGALDQNPDVSVLVTDIVLEGPRSGLDLVEEAHARRPDLGIIILSGEVRPESGRLPGKALFCTKPCAPGALLTLVNQCREW